MIDQSLTGRLVEFTLPEATITLNSYLGMTWRARVRYRRKLSWKVHLAIAQSFRPDQPFERAILEVTRSGRKRPDQDNLVGGLKAMIDIFRPQGELRFVRGAWRPANPTGLGLIVDDTPDRLLLRAQSVLCGDAEPSTHFVIHEVA